MSRTVGQVSELAGVSVRTLHHDDEIGLVQPSGRTEAGYRLYDQADLERLHTVLFYRELGFSLDRIQQVLGAAADSEPAMDAVEAHRRHISERFYDCPPQMQVGLGEMYVSDPRFRRTYEDRAEGLAEWVRDAIVANAARHAS